MQNETINPALKSLLTPADPLLLIVDSQPGLAFAVESISRVTLLNNLIALGKTARAFGLPIIATTSATQKFSGPMFPELLTALGEPEPIDRTGMNAWEDPRVVAAAQATGRRTILLAGLLTEACVTFTGLSALASGYRVLVVVDACGASSTPAHESALRLMELEGMRPRTWLQVLLELQRDWTHQSTYVAASDVVKQHAGAYGIGLNYAKAMIR